MDVVLVDGNARGLQRAMGRRRAPPGSLHGLVVPIVVIAEDGVHAERRLEAGQHRRPFVGRNDARDMAMAGDIIAEQHDEVGLQRIGVLDDRLDALQRHPGIAGVNVGDDGDLQLEIRGPLPRRQMIARDARPQLRLD